MSKEIVEIDDITSVELEARRPEDGKVEFRRRVPNSSLEKIKEKAPELTMKMLADPAVSINFGQDVVQTINDLSVKMLNEQGKVKIPEADAIVSDVLSALDGYSAKYKKYKEPGAVSKFFKKIRGKSSEAMYDIKSMVRDAKPIADRLLEAEGKIHRMELEIDENIARSQLLRETILKSLDDVAVVIAIFEEVIELGTAEIVEAEAALNEAVRNDNSMIEYRDKRYSVEEFREVLADMVTSQSEIEKSWFNWRQKFFLYIVNITSTRETINTSIGLKRTANRVRRDAIPAARTQLAQWQQAAQVEETARTIESANKGMEELIMGASRGTLAATQAAAEASQRQILSEDTILELTENLQKQFSTIVDAEIAGREARAKNLQLLQQSEAAILSATGEAQKALISRSVDQLKEGRSPLLDDDSSIEVESFVGEPRFLTSDEVKGMNLEDVSSSKEIAEKNRVQGEWVGEKYKERVNQDGFLAEKEEIKVEEDDSLKSFLD